MGFLGELANQINNQLSLGENTNHSLDSVVNGQNVKYGSLGDFTKKFDQSAERKYVEEGYLRRDPFNAEQKQFEILMQEPSATVLLKKRMFSSIAENFNPAFMDVDEKLYYKAIKVLFENKCQQISSLEKLSKIQKITSATNSVSDSLMPIIITLSDTITSSFSGDSNLFSGSSLGSQDASSLAKVIDKIRRLYAFNTTNATTTWIKDGTNLFQSQFGKGTGVIEITNFTNLTTNITVEGIKNPGSFSLSIVDPYEAMLITEWDIEKAISDATNMFNNSNLFQLIGQQGTDQIIADKQVNLNKLRSNRGAGPITIKLNPNTLLGQRVTAIFDRIGEELKFTYDSTGGTGFPGLGGITSNSVQVSSEYLKGGDIAGKDGLDTIKHGTDSELSLFQSLITTIFTKIQLDANSRNAFQVTNKKTNYARRKMRFNFSGKLIIQPMDTVHIYMKTKSQFDNKVLAGLNTMFNGFGFTQSLNAATTNIKNLGSLFNPDSSAAEKAAYVGSDFPSFLWSIMRPQFVNENEGTHIFAGVVDTANDSWSNGKFTVNVNGTDNIKYFDQGKVNFKPGVDTFNGAIFDPLTPFKSNFDSVNGSSNINGAPELLDENKSILGTSQDKRGLLKAKSGPDAGKKLASDHIITDTLVDLNSGIVSRVFHAPDGLVYKWKEGIGVFVQFGSSLDLNDPNKSGNPSLSKEPFAGQDIMNVISLLITGKPYNYANYWKAVVNIDGFGRDPQSQQDAAHSYINSLQNDLTKNNALWGNFIPFKNLVIDEQSFAQAQQAQFRILQRNQELDKKLAKLADLNQKAAMFGAANALTNDPKKTRPEYTALQSEVKVLQQSVEADVKALSVDDKVFSANATTSGPDASFDYYDFIDSSKLGISPSNPDLRRELRRQTNYLTRRMSYNVRANEDKNLFIVDDFYDKDYDILAYEQSLTDGISIYNNDFNSTREKINITADLLNLEVFADTQGHIRCRPPQYNRMPSSVFYRMMYLKKAYGIQVFPQFLDDLFTTQIDTLRKRVEILEDLIRLDCAIALNSPNATTGDQEAINFILSPDGATNGTGATFNFISDTDTGTITDINQLMHSTNPDEANVQATDFISRLESNAVSNKVIFNNSSRYSAIVDKLKKQNANADGFSVANIPSFNANGYIDQLVSRIETKSGQRINKKDYLVSNSIGTTSVQFGLNQVVDIFKVTKELQEKIEERQKVLKLFYSTLKNAVEYKALDNLGEDASNELLAPAIYGNSHIPEVFAHMIQDESYNDYGPGSGSRYIIKRAQIISLQLGETSPDFNYVEVQGVLNTFAPTALPDGLNSFPQGGNGLVTAAAIDYDSWRNYGLKMQSPIKVPFLSDPNSQCAPYANMILSRARKNILRGSVTIAGNEFQQPGEVIYLEDRGLLFYVTAVRHNFTFGGSFTTTLDLTYGHSPGEYIPTTLDIIGKMIYNNKDIASYTVQRQSGSGTDNSLGIVIMDPNSNNPGLPNVTLSEELPPEISNAPQSSFASANSATLNNILFTAAYLINANNTKGNNVKATVELRIYYDGSNAPNNRLRSFVQQVKDVLIGKVDGPSSSGSTASVFKNQPFPEDSVIIGEAAEINLDDLDDRRSPSQKAIDAARNINSTNSISISVPNISLDDSTNEIVQLSSNDKIRGALFGYIIDCWVSFNEVPLTTENSLTPETT